LAFNRSFLSTRTLSLIRRDWGSRVANQVARRLVVPPHRDGGQAQYVERPVPRERAGGSRLAGLLDRVREALDQDWPVERMATEAAVSPRALHRRFQEASGVSPGAWLLAERMARARELLEDAALPIEDVATACGFGTAATCSDPRSSVLPREIIGVSCPQSVRLEDTSCPDYVRLSPRRIETGARSSASAHKA